MHRRNHEELARRFAEAFPAGNGGAGLDRQDGRNACSPRGTGQFAASCESRYFFNYAKMANYRFLAKQQAG
jgi:hypothetical protein